MACWIRDSFMTVHSASSAHVRRQFSIVTRYIFLVFGTKPVRIKGEATTIALKQGRSTSSSQILRRPHTTGSSKLTVLRFWVLAAKMSLLVPTRHARTHARDVFQGQPRSLSATAAASSLGVLRDSRNTNNALSISPFLKMFMQSRKSVYVTTLCQLERL